MFGLLLLMYTKILSYCEVHKIFHKTWNENDGTGMRIEMKGMEKQNERREEMMEF